MGTDDHSRARAAHIVGERQLTHRMPTERPTIVYVSDFDVESEQPAENRGLLRGGGPARAIVGRLRGESAGPDGNARQIVDLMSDSLVRDLEQGGIPARRLAPGASLPRTGWLVRGVFTEASEGSRVRRAVIGFGAGGTDLEVWVNIADLKNGHPQPFYQLEAVASSRKTPGAIVTKNPYVAAAKFVMSRRDLPRNVKQAAHIIASEIVSRPKQ